MAKRRQQNPLILGLLAFLLVCPPMTSVMAAGLGVDLSHHHCGPDVHEAGDVHHHEPDVEHSGIEPFEQHGSSERVPYQCDQCHIALAAMTSDMPVALIVEAPLPSPETVVVLYAIPPPPAFKPPIA